VTGYVSITTLGTQLVTYRFRVVIFIHKFITHYLIEEGECFAVGMLFSIGGVTPGGELPIVGYTGSLRLKGVAFLSSQYIGIKG